MKYFGRYRIEKIVTAAAAVVCTLAALDIGYRWANLDTRPPVVFGRVEVITPEVRAGESVQVKIYRTKVRDDCPVNSNRTAVFEDGTVFSLGGLTWVGGPAGTEFLAYEYPTQIHMPVGNYIMRVLLAYLCPDEIYLIPQPDFSFRIVP